MLIKKPVKVTKRMRIRFDKKKNPRRNQFNEKNKINNPK